MARAKQTDRAEARRRYRQTTTEVAGDDDAALDFGERRPDATPAQPTQAQEARAERSRRSAAGLHRRVPSAVPAAENPRGHPGAAVPAAHSGASSPPSRWSSSAQSSSRVFPNYTGSRFAWELLVLPGSALAPQLVAGFFAPRASYLLGLIVGIVQGVVVILFLTTSLAARDDAGLTRSGAC